VVLGSLCSEVQLPTEEIPSRERGKGGGVPMRCHQFGSMLCHERVICQHATFLKKSVLLACDFPKEFVK
jgi:hypothetical protein